jgi:hypothetical protein
MQPLSNRPGTIRFVSCQAAGTFPGPAERLGDRDVIHHGLDLRRFMPLSGSHFHRQRQAQAIRHQMDLAAETAAGTA